VKDCVEEAENNTKGHEEVWNLLLFVTRKLS